MPHSLSSRQEALPHVHDLTGEQLVALQSQAARQAGKPVRFRDAMTSGGEGPEMVVIPAGSFEMGSEPAEIGHEPEEAPKHIVTVGKPFAIGRYPLMGEEFERYARAVNWRPARDLIWAGGRYPAINIRVGDFLAYMDWLHRETGARYRLPTEAEWEYAARAGSRTAFHFGDEASCREVFSNPFYPAEQPKVKRRLFFPRCTPLLFAMEVGDKAPNLWGLSDVHGNVWEFTANPWADSHAHARRDGQPHAAAPRNEWIVVKGGSWFDPPVAARSAARRKRLRDELDVNLGVRLVRDL